MSAVQKIETEVRAASADPADALTTQLRERDCSCGQNSSQAISRILKAVGHPFNVDKFVMS